MANKSKRKQRAREEAQKQKEIRQRKMDNNNEDSFNGDAGKNQPKIDTTPPSPENKVQLDAGNNLSTTEVNTPLEQSSIESSEPKTKQDLEQEASGEVTPTNNQSTTSDNHIEDSKTAIDKAPNKVKEGLSKEDDIMEIINNLPNREEVISESKEAPSTDEQIPSQEIAKTSQSGSPKQSTVEVNTPKNENVAYDFENDLYRDLQDVEANHRITTDPEAIKLRGLENGKISNRKMMLDEYAVARKRFDRAQTYYRQSIDKIDKINNFTDTVKESFLSIHKDKKDMISDDKIKEIKKHLDEAKNEYNKKVQESKIAGIKAPEFDKNVVDRQIAERVFGNAGDAEMAAVGYGRLKMTADDLTAKYEKRKNILGKYIDSAQKAGENKIARGPRAGGSGFGKKAAIFGGVALGALSLVGVTNLVMSGGRQSNSNLYNPYQAMY